MCAKKVRLKVIFSIFLLVGWFKYASSNNTVASPSFCVRHMKGCVNMCVRMQSSAPLSLCPSVCVCVCVCVCVLVYIVLAHT